MANHPYNNHREQQVAHRRVGTILSGSPAGAQQHAKGHAFSKITSKSAASRDDDISGRKSPQRFARGGKVKHGGGNTNIAIVLPKGGGPAPGGPAALPMAGPGGPPMPPPPMGGPPPGLPPGMPMRARGGKVDGEATEGNIKKWGNRAKDNSYFTGGAISGVGRQEKAAHMKGRK